MKSSRLRNHLIVVTALAAVYFITGKLGLQLAFVNASASAIWPPTGISLAAILLLGYGAWPGILLGAFLVNATTAGTLATSLGIAIGNTLEALVGGWLVNRFAGGRRAFGRSADLFRFAALAGLLAPTLSATLGVTSLGLGGFVRWPDLGLVWFTWWLGDAGGALVVAPALILASSGSRLLWTRRRAAEAGLLALGGLLVAGIVFGVLPHADPATRALAFLCLPFLIGTAFRFGPREAGLLGLALSAIALWGTLSGGGPFARFSPNKALLLLQAFMSVTMTVGLALAAVVQERRCALETLEKRAADLARSNAELEQFAHMAAHDLQEPLRMVASYVQLLERRYRGRLDQDADEFISQAVDGAVRMKELVDGLLEYSTARSGEPRLEMTDCRRCVERALANLSFTARESGANVSLGDLPIVEASAPQITQLFQNLISNAIRFRGEAPPEIHVASERRGFDWLFSVRDNGIGVDPRDSGRIFNLFERTRGRGRYPGTGVGLAICRNIVERHGGRIWVESKPGRGSTFFFTLPTPQARRDGWVARAVRMARAGG